MQIMTPDQQSRAEEPGLQMKAGTSWNMKIQVKIPGSSQFGCGLKKNTFGPFPKW